MALLIGMDEAGLGPNLGPFVVAVTVWDVPGNPREFDFWETFSDVLTNAPEPKDPRLHIADSKQVFQPHCGFGGLERGVLSALRMLEHEPKSFDELVSVLTSTESPKIGSEQPAPWYRDVSYPLPAEEHDFSFVERWHDSCRKHQVRLVAIKAAIIEPDTFNQMIDEYDNKALVVSRVAFRLLRSVWSPDAGVAFIVGDKHGGRNRYDQLLSEVLDGEMIFRVEESANQSVYRVEKSVLRFQPRAEVHGPVALASMTAKYVREVAMTLFNRFWQSHIEGLKHTQGYPVDAKRFHSQIAEMQRTLGISDDCLWRNR